MLSNHHQPLDPFWESTVPQGEFIKDNQRDRTGAGKGRWRAMGGPEHLPRGQALRGDRDLRENQQGPERDKNRHVWALSHQAASAASPRPPPPPAPATPSVLTPGEHHLIPATPHPGKTGSALRFPARGRQAPCPHVCSHSSRLRWSPDLQASRMCRKEPPPGAKPGLGHGKGAST